MKYPFFASFILLCLIILYNLNKWKKKETRQYENFLAEEAAANAVRRKSLDDLSYITIPFDSLPMNALTDNDKVMEYHQTLKDLSENPIVNLTGFTNTELKFKYGAPNLDLLTQYDSSYTILARTLNDWAKELLNGNLESEAVIVLEFAVSTHTDISSTYEMLSKIYKEKNEIDKLQSLVPIAENLNTMLSKNIANKIKEMIP